MKHKKILLGIVLFFVLAVGGYAILSNGHVQNTALAQEKTENPVDGALSVKIQQLRSEMKKTSSNFDNSEQVTGLLEQVLSDKGSINLLPNDIMGDESNYDLKYIDEITINNHKQRIVQFQINDKQGKPITSIYIQNTERATNVPVQRLYGPVLPDKAQLVSCDFLPSNNASYISVIYKMYGGDDIRDEDIHILADVFKYDGTEWRESPSYNSTNCTIKNKHWEMYSDISNPGCQIQNDQARSFKGKDFVIKVSNNKMEITLVDKNKQSLDNMQAVFQNGQWKKLKSVGDTQFVFENGQWKKLN